MRNRTPPHVVSLIDCILEIFGVNSNSAQGMHNTHIEQIKESTCTMDTNAVQFINE